MISSDIFRTLHREHVNKLLDIMKVGQHALLLEIWDSAEVLCFCFCNDTEDF